MCTKLVCFLYVSLPGPFHEVGYEKPGHDCRATTIILIFIYLLIIKFCEFLVCGVVGVFCPFCFDRCFVPDYQQCIYLRLVKLTLLRLNFWFQLEESNSISYKKNSNEITHFQVLLLLLSIVSNSTVHNANDCWQLSRE